MKLPKCNFRWASELQKRAIGIYLETLKLRFKEKTFKEENSSLENILNEKNIGIFAEVDLKYPSKLHNSHSDFTLCPKRLPIEKELLSSPQKKTFMNYFIIKNLNSQKN